MNQEDVADALGKLSNQQADRSLEIERQPTTRTVETDEEADSESPILDAFYNQNGNEAIMTLTGLTAPELRLLYSKLHPFIVTNWNIGRGRRSPQKPLDMLLMLLTVLKNGGTWGYLAQMFRMKTSSFERAMSSFISILAPHAYTQFVTSVQRKYNLSKLVQEEKLFRSFPLAIDAVDVTFQQSNRPSGNLRESKLYYSGKYHLYGYKLEVSVRPNGLASDSSVHHPGSISDLTIMHNRLDKHRQRTRKRGSDTQIEDNGDLHEKFPNYWQVLVDKGYQGSREFIRSIHPHRKPPRGVLSHAQENYNRALSSDRIIVENYFGRLGSMWSIMSQKYMWSEDQYDDIAKLCISFTNFNVELHPLRAADGTWYRQYLNLLSEIARGMTKERSDSQARSRNRRRRRMGVPQRSNANNNNSNVHDEDDDQDNVADD